LIPTLLLPFNLIKGSVNMAITLILYKPITAALKKSGLINSKNYTNKKKFALVSLLSVVVIVVCLLVVFYIFNGSLEIFG
jgi:riboflavin transporter FmnP